VSGTLQRSGDEPGKLGITLELADIVSQRAFRLWTHWELPVAPASASAPIAAAAQLNSADAMCALAAAYEAQGALEQAKSSYEAALQQKPDLAEARDGLLRVLGMPWTLSERYSNLLRPSMRRLALELAKRVMQKRGCRLCGKTKRISYEARTLNFFGALYEASYQTFGGEFARLAIADLQRAIDLDPEWYQPYENLADVYTLMAQRETDQRTSVQHLHSALLQYVVALARARKAAEGQETLNRIMVGMATAQLLTGTAALVEKARSNILALTQAFPLGNQMDSRYLYNLASWYGFANQGQPPEASARDAARRILGYSLGREHDPDVWSYAEWDPAFKGTCDGLDVLEFTIAEEIQRRLSAGEMGLNRLPGDEFTLVMETIFKQADWLC
jgi:tetratricopeptide (TPR) repeat protein